MNPKTPLRAGNGTRITRTPLGQSVSMQRSTWHHPWFSAAYWWPAKKEWVAIVRPGFVNGRAPFVLTTGERMKATPSFLAPVTAWDGAADIQQAAELASENETPTGTSRIYVPLYRNPLLHLPFRELGGKDAPIPQYFVRRGITAVSGRRVVYSDIVLQQPRMALTSQISVPMDLVFGSSIVTQTLSERSPSKNERLRVMAVPQINPPLDYDPGQAGLLRDYEEATWDELLLATVYLVSPPNAQGSPDGSWLPSVKHSQFWNLNWHQPRLSVLAGDPGVGWIPPLVGGGAILFTSSIISSINDMTNQALNIVRAHSMAGTFWTATGGGSDAAFPAATTATADAFGLAKDARNKAARAAAIKSGALIDTLDPAFPYSTSPFSLSLL